MNRECPRNEIHAGQGIKSPLSWDMFEECKDYRETIKKEANVIPMSSAISKQYAKTKEAIVSDFVRARLREGMTETEVTIKGGFKICGEVETFIFDDYPVFSITIVSNKNGVSIRVMK